jgi:hypothetical protein
MVGRRKGNGPLDELSPVEHEVPELMAGLRTHEAVAASRF